MKRIIRNEYGFHHIQKIWIDLDTLTFKLRLGDCMSMDIDLPIQIKRELKINKLLRERWKGL